MPIPAQQDPMVRTTARERVYKTLQKWIVNGTLLPEERLNDVELAHHFRVSRTPVREALQMLAEQKLVMMVPSSGTFVAPIDREDMAYVYELLGDLQACALERGIENVTARDLAELREINRRFYQCGQSGSAVDMIGEDWAFHHRIAELAKNPYLTSYTEQLMLQAHRNEVCFFQGNAHARQSFDAHSGIIQALEAKDLEAAKISIRQNWRVSME